MPITLFGMRTSARLIAYLIGYLIRVVSYFGIFRKAGEKGWKGLIPVYNHFTEYSITWAGGFALLRVVLVLFYCACVYLTMDGGYPTRDVGPVLLGVLAAVAELVIHIIGCHKLSKAFGRGVGFTVGLIFLNPIFMLVLAFGSSECLRKPLS